MGESSTAMRDPIFYRWHAFVNGMFEEYKHTLPPYTLQEVKKIRNFLPMINMNLRVN